MTLIKRTLQVVKTSLWLCLLCLLVLPSSAKANLSDSLRHMVRLETAALETIYILKLAAQHSHKNTELAIFYTEMALDKARKSNKLEDLYQIYRERGFIYEENNLLHQALAEFENALNIANRLDNDSHRLSVYTDLAVLNRKLSNYKATTDYHTMTLFLAEQIGDKEMVEDSYHGLGTVYDIVGDYDKAIEYYFKSLAIAEERNSISGVIITLQNISNTFINTQNKEQALGNIERAYRLASSTSDSLTIANVLYDYGKILNKVGEHSKALEKHQAALEVYQTVQRKTAIVRSMIEISTVYTNMEQYDKAQEYFQLCFDKYREYLSNKDNAHLYNKQGYLFLKLNENEKAEEAFLKGLAISTKNDYKAISQENHHALYRIYREFGQTDKALVHLEESNKFQNYIQNNEKTQRIAEVQFQYEVEKSERRIQELRYSRNQLFFFGLSFFLTVIAAFLVYTNSIKVRNNKALLKRNEESEKQNRRLEESNQALRQFAYAAAHDLKEPLRNIGSFISLLQKKYGHQFNEEANSYMNFVTNGAKRMNNLLVDLLEFSTLTTQQASNELINLRSVIDEVVGNLQDVIVAQNALINYPDRMPSVRMKRIHLIQLFQNMVSNSLKFVDGQPEINIQYFPEPEHILLMVEDNGIGINKDYEDKVFLLFQQLDKSKGYEGTGIGLTICKTIVDKYNGQIWFESGNIKGTRFFVRLPILEETTALVTPQQKPKAQTELAESY